MIYLLVGPDHYLVETEITRLTRAADPDGLNTSRFDRSESIADVSNAVATSGFFGSSRVVIAEGILTQFRGQPKARKADLSELESLFASVAPGNVLILVDPELQTIPADVRKLAGPDAIQFGGGVPRGTDLQNWVVEQVHSSGGEIKPHTASVLLDRLFPHDWRQVHKNPAYDRPPELQRLISEIAKLVTHADGSEIQPGDIKNLVVLETADELFLLLDAVVHGNASGALTRLGYQQSDDDGASRILNQLVANAELGQVAVHFRSEAALQGVGKELGGVSAGRLAAIQRTFSRLSPTRFADIVLESDRRLKTGFTRTPADQLHEIIIRRAIKSRDQ